ncbi:MAG: hypothetical protein ACMUEM_06470 [Flavobacteriales bacterium AspAUS03]
MTLSRIKQTKFNYTANKLSSLDDFLTKSVFFYQGRTVANGQQTFGGSSLGAIFSSQEDTRQRLIDSSWITTSDVVFSSYNRSRDEK